LQAIVARHSRRYSAPRLIEETHMKETRKPVRKPRTPVASKPAAEPAPKKGKTAVRKKAATDLPQRPQPPAAYDVTERIRLAAYYLAERRGFVSGHELEDWFAAEAGVRAVTAPSRRTRQATGQRRSAR
jgi:Protein of unknown function (DUF2934)